MLDPKEQAKYYLENVKSIGKATTQVLFVVFIPLAFIWLTQIETTYSSLSVNDYFKNAERKLDFQLSINKKRESIDTFKTLNSASKDSLFISGFKGDIKNDSFKKNPFAVYAEANKQIDDTISTLTKLIKKKQAAKIQANDSIRTALNSIGLSINVPILNVKLDKVSIKFITLFIMFFFSCILMYTYYMKIRILTNINKFRQIVEAKFPNADGLLYNDYDFNLPFWFFPCRVNNRDNFTISSIIALKPDIIKRFNAESFLILLLFLLVNARLAMLNWAFNYKVFHTNYSIYNTLCLALLLIDILYTVRLVSPILKRAVDNTMNSYETDFGRRKLILCFLSIGVASCFFEPLYGRIYNGKKWYHVPRFRKKLKLNFNNGLYIHKGKKSKVYYFEKNKLPSSIRSLNQDQIDKFSGNLKEINVTDLKKHYLNFIAEADLIRVIKSQSYNTDGLLLLNTYLESKKATLSVEMIDLYTKLYAPHKGKLPTLPPAVVKRINDSIKFYESANSIYLKGYLPIKDIKKKKKPVSDYEKQKQETIQRIENWKKRLKIHVPHK